MSGDGIGPEKRPIIRETAEKREDRVVMTKKQKIGIYQSSWSPSARCLAIIAVIALEPLRH